MRGEALNTLFLRTGLWTFCFLVSSTVSYCGDCHTSLYVLMKRILSPFGFSDSLGASL